MQRPSAVDHEIFGDDFKPVHNRLAGKDVIIVRRPQADPNSIIRKSIKAIFRHASLQGIKVGEGQNRRPPPRREASFWNRRSGWLFPAVGPAATLALAGVFALAAVVACLAGALALAGVLALTGVSVLLVLGFFRLLILALVLILGAERSLQRGEQSRGFDCRSGPGE